MRLKEFVSSLERLFILGNKEAKGKEEEKEGEGKGEGGETGRMASTASRKYQVNGLVTSKVPNKTIKPSYKDPLYAQLLNLGLNLEPPRWGELPWIASKTTQSSEGCSRAVPSLPWGIASYTVVTQGITFLSTTVFPKNHCV